MRFLVACVFLIALLLTAEAQFRPLRGYGTYGPAWRRRLWQDGGASSAYTDDTLHEIRTRLARF